MQRALARARILQRLVLHRDFAAECVALHLKLGLLEPAARVQAPEALEIFGTLGLGRLKLGGRGEKRRKGVGQLGENLELVLALGQAADFGEAGLERGDDTFCRIRGDHE